MKFKLEVRKSLASLNFSCDSNFVFGYHRQCQLCLFSVFKTQFLTMVLSCRMFTDCIHQLFPWFVWSGQLSKTETSTQPFPQSWLCQQKGKFPFCLFSVMMFVQSNCVWVLLITQLLSCTAFLTSLYKVFESKDVELAMGRLQSL